MEGHRNNGIGDGRWGVALSGYHRQLGMRGGCGHTMSGNDAVYSLFTQLAIWLAYRYSLFSLFDEIESADTKMDANLNLTHIGLFPFPESFWRHRALRIQQISFKGLPNIFFTKNSVFIDPEFFAEI
jgi:hypothetical protein